MHPFEELYRLRGFSVNSLSVALASRVGMSQRQINRRVIWWLAGEAVPSEKEFNALASILNLSVEDLSKCFDYPPPPTKDNDGTRRAFRRNYQRARVAASLRISPEDRELLEKNSSLLSVVEAYIQKTCSEFREFLNNYPS